MIREAQIGSYACITHLDHQIGRLLEALPANTVVVFTGDHGEMLCDHHLYRKSLPYRGSANVPLIISGANAHGRMERLCELRDILPTLACIAGGEAPAFSDGENLLDGAPGREFLHGEHTNGALSNHYIVTKRDKYVWAAIFNLTWYCIVSLVLTANDKTVPDSLTVTPDTPAETMDM